ncbi:MAG: hypothetical protein ACJATG_001191 [Dinoroseobacter sp.]|jgi:hypothetical protein
MRNIAFDFRHSKARVIANSDTLTEPLRKAAAILARLDLGSLNCHLRNKLSKLYRSYGKTRNFS